MTQIFGHFLQELPEEDEYLTLFFLPRYFNSKFWETNKLSAELLADYFNKFIKNQMAAMGKEVNNIEINNLKHAVKYIANELLENAMKFQDRTIKLTTHLKLSLYREEVIFYVTNSINPQQVKSFQTFIKQLLTHNPDELYLKTIKANATEENQTRSSLGLLSMICFYSVKLGWKFETHQTKLPIMTVSTMVCLKIKDVQNEVLTMTNQ